MIEQCLSHMQSNDDFDVFWYEQVLIFYKQQQSEIVVTFLQKQSLILGDKIQVIINQKLANNLIQLVQVYINKFAEILNYILIPIHNRDRQLNTEYLKQVLVDNIDPILNKIDFQDLYVTLELLLNSTRNDPYLETDKLLQKTTELLSKYDLTDLKTINIFDIQNLFVNIGNNIHYEIQQAEIKKIEQTKEQIQKVKEYNQTPEQQILQIPGLNLERFKKFAMSIGITLNQYNIDQIYVQDNNTKDLLLMFEEYLNTLKEELKSKQQTQLTTEPLDYEKTIRDIYCLFDNFLILKDILFFQLNAINSEYYIDKSWQEIIQNESHLNLIQQNLGNSLFLCVQRIIQLNIDSIKQLTNNIEITEQWLHDILQVRCEKIVGMCLYSDQQTLFQLHSVQVLVQYIDNVRSLLVIQDCIEKD